MNERRLALRAGRFVGLWRLGSGAGRQGKVGQASSVLVEAAEIVPFAVAWMERVAR